MMSLRPRPVTATVTKPRWMQAEALAGGPSNFDMNSTGSTESLTSCLDHDSYISPVDSEDEFEKEKAIIENERKIDAQKRKKESGKESRKYVEPEKRGYDEDDLEPNLSPWEKWLIIKTQEERDKRKAASRQKRQLKLEKEIKEAEKQKQLLKAEEKRHEWLEQKNYEEELRKKMAKQRLRTEKEIKQDKSRQIAEKSEKNFSEWIVKKTKEEKEIRRKEKQKQKEEERKTQEKHNIAEEKFAEWCRKAQNRPKSVPNSFGYTSGKLTGYHDTGAYPVPSFYNPIPWHPPHVSKPKSEKKSRPKPKKYVWNPNKYY